MGKPTQERKQRHTVPGQQKSKEEIPVIFSFAFHNRLSYLPDLTVSIRHAGILLWYELHRLNNSSSNFAGIRIYKLPPCPGLTVYST